MPSKFNLRDQKSAKWSVRTQCAVELFSKARLFGPDAPIRIADVGCGDKKLAPLLKSKFSNATYLAYDLLPQAEDVQRLDLEQEIFSAYVDVTFCLGVIEYLTRPQFFLEQLKEKSSSLILSYVVRERSRYTPLQIAEKNWKHHLKSEEVVVLLLGCGWEIINSQLCEDQQTMIWHLQSSCGLVKRGL